VNPWVWVLAAYGCAALVVGGYAVWIWRRLREARATEEVEG
jgi:hypothetical protein